MMSRGDISINTTTMDGNIFSRWRADPASFIEQLINPDTGKPFVLFPAERTFLQHAFKTDTTGRLLYPDLIYAAPKKTGKTGFAALIELTIVLLFGGRNAEGFCAANDYEQAQGRVFEMIKRIIEATPFLKPEAKITAEKIVFPAMGNATIIAIASDAASAAGGAPTISVFDELWGYRSERARRLWDEMVPTPTRKISCRLVVSYAGFSGESELLEDLYNRAMAQPEIAPDLHAGDGLLCFWTHTPQAPWQDEAWLASMRRSLRPSQYARMIENRWVSAESTFIDMALWDQCVDPAMRSVVTDRYMPVWAAVDASIRRDSTALVAVTWSQKDQCVRLVNHRIIQPSAEQPIDFEATVETTLIDWRRRFNLRAVFYDPYQMIASAQRLTREGLTMVEYPQTVSNLTEASQNLFDLIKGRNLVAYPDEQIRLAISRAVAVETARGWRIGKDKQTHKIDVVVALGMAALAATKREFGTVGYPLSVWRAANGDDAPIDDYDGSREWRDRRCPPTMSMEEWVKLTGASRPTWGPEAPGAVSLGDGGYRAPIYEEQCQIAWAEQARIRAALAEAEKNKKLP
jgi:Phage Terminase